MDTGQAQVLVSILPATIDLVLEDSSDAWFAIVAIITLWAYVMFAPGSKAHEG